MRAEPATLTAAGLALAQLLLSIAFPSSRVMAGLAPATHAGTWLGLNRKDRDASEMADCPVALPNGLGLGGRDKSGHDAAWLVAESSGCADREALSTFTSKEWPLTVRYPASLRISSSFKQSYFDRGDWRFSYAAGAGSGTPIVAFALPDLHAADAGGESEAFAEVTIGASRDPDVLATCLSYGTNSGNNVEQRTRTIGGVTFTEVPDNGDTEMMKTIATDDFRAVKGDTCWAIDVVRYAGGTSSRRPDYSPTQIDTLQRVLDGIRFE